MLVVTLLVASCVGPSNSTGGRTKAAPGDMQRLADVTERNAQVCETKTAAALDKLREAIARIEGGPIPERAAKARGTLQGAVSKLSALKVSAKLDVMGPPSMPVVVLVDPLTDPASGSAARTVPAQVELNVLREDIGALNAALGAGFFSTSSCNDFAQGLTRTLGTLDDRDVEPSSALLSAYRRMLQASLRSQAVVASSVGLIGVMQAGLAGKGAEAVDALLGGVKATLASPEPVTDDQAQSTYRMAQAELRARAGRPAPAEGPPVSPSGRGDAGDELVRRLVPRDGMLADATTALLAIKNGDYLGALKSAFKVAGRLTPVGNALASVLTALA